MHLWNKRSKYFFPCITAGTKQSMIVKMRICLPMQKNACFQFMMASQFRIIHLKNLRMNFQACAPGNVGKNGAKVVFR